MTKKTAKMVLILGILAVLIVGVAGCTSSTQNASSGSASSGNNQNLALAYANALTQPANIGLGPNETLVSSNVVANGSDGARLTETISNTTPQSLWANGTSTTLGINIQYFSSTGEATAFYNNQSFGYTPTSNLTIINGSSLYEQVMGHAPSISDGAYKLVNFNFASAQIDVVVQRGEFVMWGEVTETGL
ncbi:MAG: hypothetical protein ABR979_01730 [Halobacteriota archaeon]|jgi:hypothetical protein